MDNKDVDVPDPKQFQSETGPKPQTLFLADISSPIFHTIPFAGNLGTNLAPKYYIEQLGSPSILKSFRDLPVCTRLSVGTTPTPHRALQLDKLSKIDMGKTHRTTSFPSGKRGEGDKSMPPIQVNAKIHHIYSHVTSENETSSSSKRPSRRISSTVSVQTQTDDVGRVPSSSGKNHEAESEFRKDAFTCMTPPTPHRLLGETSNIPVPPAYVGKLEDLEKITGHIVIQKFFTRADEAFGMWLEKQLGMNVKSVAVGEGSVEEPSRHGMDPILRRPMSETRTREATLLEKIEEIEDILDNDEEAIKVVNSGEVGTSRIVSESLEKKTCSIHDKIKCECFIEYYRVEESKEEERGQDEKSEEDKDVTDMEKELISQCITLEIIPETETVSIIGTSETDERLNSKDDNKNKQMIELIPNVEEKETLNERPFIPDVIDVSQFSEKGIEKASNDTNVLETNGDSEEGETVIQNLQLTEKEMSNYKVVDYLGKLEPHSHSPSQTPASLMSLTSEAAEREEQDETKDAKDKYDEPDEDEIKRSMSVDSCIGTESSGERTVFNDAGSLLDSARIDSKIPEEVEIGGLDVNKDEQQQDSTGQQIVETEPLDGSSEVLEVAKQPSGEEKIDAKFESAKGSTPIKQISDEAGDADQSELNTEEESEPSLSMRRDRTFVKNSTEMGAGEDDGVTIDEDEDDNTDQEPDQFDTIIENHEREKRLRPVCGKKNMTTQTTESLDSSTLSTSCESSRASTATSASSSSFYDLELISKSRKYISKIHPQDRSKHVEEVLDFGISKKRSYLPTGASGLNVLNMRFTVGKEFSSSVSIRIPPTKSPSDSASSSHSFQYQNLPNLMPKHQSSSGGKQKHSSSLPVIGATSGEEARGKGTASTISSRRDGSLPDTELKELWHDVKNKMESKVETESSSGLQVTGNKIRLVSSTVSGSGSEIQQEERIGFHTQSQSQPEPTKLPALINVDQERIKRSLKKLQKMLDD